MIVDVTRRGSCVECGVYTASHDDGRCDSCVRADGPPSHPIGRGARLRAALKAESLERSSTGPSA